MNQEELLVVLVSAPTKADATVLADALVGQHLAACVSIVPGMTSVYNWKGQRESSEEVLLVIKTRAELFTDLERTVRATHPYDVPEIVGIPASRVASAYLEWVAAETNTGTAATDS